MQQRQVIKTLDDAIECYGRDNIVPITYQKQAIFYVKLGCQPVLVWPKEGDDKVMSYWFLKSETYFAKKKWDATRPSK